MTRYRGLLQLASVLCFVTAVLIYTKYIAAVYYYEILFDSNDRPLFVVRQQTGKRSTTLCRIDLSDIQSVTKLSREDYKAHKTPSHMKKYVYTPSLFPSTLYLMTSVGRYEVVEIIIEGSDEFAELLRTQAAEARELYPRYEE